LTHVRYNSLRINNAHIFNEYDKTIDLYYALNLAVNFVSYDINRLFDKQGKMMKDDVTGGYAPHLPIEALRSQNCINISSRNPSELKRILNLLLIDRSKNDYALSNIQLLLRSDRSSRGQFFKKANFLMSSKKLFNTMDMNFMTVLGHSLEQKSKMSTQLILEYIFEYKHSYSNY
jgi:hypothetical protein